MGKHFTSKSPAQTKAIKRNYAIKANVGNTKKITKSLKENLDMRLAKIRNRYMFKGDKPDETHTYAVYTDLGSGEVRAIETTHLYVPDEKNMSRLHKGLLKKVKFAGYETPSGVSNKYYSSNVDGNPIDLKHKDIVSIDKTPLPQKQAREIRDFAKNSRER